MSALSLRPRLGRQPERKAERRLLLVCSFDPSGVATIYENIALWQKFSRYGIEVLNLWPGRSARLTMPHNIELGDYSGVVVHCTASYHPDNLYSLDKQLERPFEQYDGIKILMKQDEHFCTNSFARYIGQKAFDLVITCVPPEEQSKVYPAETVGSADFLHVLTGYVSPFMRSLNAGPLATRPVDIAYRGSIQPLSFGRLGFEKRKIAYDVGRIASRHPLRTDISCQWKDRLGGIAWFDFLGRTKAVLGVESATNLFDFTGEVDAWCHTFERCHPDLDHLAEDFYDRAHREYLHSFEGNVNYAQISPRHLESAATRSVQILYEGAYSGIFHPYTHYLPLHRDLSNFDEVIEALTDQRQMAELTDRAFEEIVLNQSLRYEYFVEQFDLAIDRALARKGQAAPSSRRSADRNEGRRALVLVGHEPTNDPRIEWMAEGLSADFTVCELGLHADGAPTALPTRECLSDRRTRVRVGRYRHDWDLVPNIADLATKDCCALRHLTLLHVLAELPARALARSIGALDATEEELTRFRWYARHFVHTNCALLQAARLIGRFDAVVAADLETLPAAILMGEESGAAVLYDAHEFWPYSLMEFRHWEIEFWAAFDRNLAARAAVRATVSPPLAALMSQEYGCTFLSIPNCTLQRSGDDIELETALQRVAAREAVQFLFLGAFAPGRGIEDLIAAWSAVTSGARLSLQGPDNSFKSEMIGLADSLGLLGDRVSFPPAVGPGEMLSAARAADVGVIPYAASSINNRYCSPNKLSQYMAAGLPILCNDLDFVKSVVADNGLGIAVDFRDRQALAAAIDRMAAERSEIIAMSRRSRRYFETRFHWEAVSGEMYGQLSAAVSREPTFARAALDFSWIEHGREMHEPAAATGDVPSPCSEVTQAAYAEIQRLNEIYPAEINRLNDVYSAEIRRLNEVYPAEIERYAIELRRYDQFHWLMQIPVRGERVIRRQARRAKRLLARLRA